MQYNDFQKRLLHPSVGWLVVAGAIFAQEAGKKPSGREQSSNSYLYAPASTDGLGSPTRITEHQKLLDDKNYERTTSFRALSINGGERVDREESERSRRVSDTRQQVDGPIRTPALNGRLATEQLIKEEHEVKGNTEETQRSYYRPDLNGKMAAQVVENETVVKTSAKEKVLTRALYRPVA